MIQLFKHPLTTVQVSLYSMTPKIHDEITTINGSFKKTFENLKKLIDSGVNVMVGCPIMDINKEDSIDVFNWCVQHNIQCNQDADIMAECDFCTQNLSHRPNIDELKEVFKRKLTLRTEKIDVNKVEKEFNIDSRVCGAGLSGVSINSYGDIRPCPGWDSCVCGNVKDNSISDILLNSPILKKIRAVRYRDFKKCDGCKDRPFCLICMSKNANENNGDYMKITDHNCDVTRAYKAMVLKYCSLDD